MKLAELISKELRNKFEVYLNDGDSLTVDRLVFTSTINWDNEEEREQWKENYTRYANYDVLYLYAYGTSEINIQPLNAILRITIKTPIDDEEYPF